MKRFSTLATVVAIFFAAQTNAQTNYFEDFETALTDPSNGCIAMTDILYATKQSSNTIKGFVINNNASAYVEPPVSGATVRVFSTPYLNLPASLTIAFNYQLTQKLAGSATRFINVGTIDANNNFVSLDSFGVADILTVVNYSKTFDIGTATTARIAFRFGGAGGDGNSRVAFDNISINAPMFNGGNCNTAPVARPNTYYPLLATDIVTGNVITDINIDGSGTGNDSDAEDGITLTVNPLTLIDPTIGTLDLQPNGSFTFTPSATFVGGPVTFNYSVTDFGYPRMSATTTVTLEYPALSTLPVRMTSFSGSASNNKAQLRWSVAENETGDHFQVMRSSDGKNFSEAGVVFINNRVGAESYTFTDKQDLDAVTYYKLKIINKDKSVSYSNVIILKSATDKGAKGLTILKNPVESTLTFTYSAATATQSNVTIYNASGVKVYSSRISSQKGTNSVSLNLDSHMAAGTYILEVANGTDRMVTKLLKK
jgi:hypothetical protein